jgi:hypothetical protein
LPLAQLDERLRKHLLYFLIDATFFSDFASMVVEKIGSMIADPQTDTDLKILLMENLATFQDNAAINENVQ